MSYRNDQWHNLVGSDNEIVNTDKNDAGYYITEANNDKFVYPTRRVRTLGRGTGTGLFGNAQVNNVPVSTTLKRGYIRSLLTEGSGSRKCQFQFNPASINQSVSQNSSILNFLQSDPAQYVQPIPGNVTFQFSTFFDRTMEVVNGDVPVSDLIRDFRSDNPWEKAPPGQVGVLHDLAALFSIIGVGVSEYMSNKLRQGVEDSEAEFFNTETIRAFASEDDDLTVDEFLDSFNSLVAVNKGNSAFLLPLPVRIVFSSLYIVEGMVKDIDVLYQKFSTNMVPIQARVDITLEAKYIGFAKKDTFFTNALSHLSGYADRQAAAGNKSVGAISEDYLTAVSGDLSRVRMLVVSASNTDNENAEEAVKDKINNVSGGGTTFNNFAKSITTSGTNADFSRQLASEPPGTENPKHIRLHFPEVDTSDGGRVGGLFAAGTNVSVEAVAEATLWRVLDNETISNIERNLNEQSISSKFEKEELLANLVQVRKFDNITTVNRVMDDAMAKSKSSIETVTLAEETTSGERTYKAISKLWTVSLDSSNLLTKDSETVALNKATTFDDWKRFSPDGDKPFQVTSGPQRSFEDDRSSTYLYDGEQYRSVETNYGGRYYLAYSVVITVEIEDTGVTRRNFTVVKKYTIGDLSGYLSPFDNDEHFLMQTVADFAWDGDSEEITD